MGVARARRRAPNYRSKAWPSAGAVPWLLACAAACSSPPAPRVVTLYTLETGSLSDAAYTATGDFSPPEEQSDSLSDVGGPLASLPPATRSLVIVAGDFTGVSLVDAAGPVDVLALRFHAVSTLPGTVAAPPVGPGPGQTMGLVDAHHALLVGGAGSTPPSVINLGTGAVDPASPSLALARNGASITPWGSGAIVAGGTGSNGPEASFEVFDLSASSVGGFGQTGSIGILLKGRTEHGAAVLDGGESLLVGGVGGVGRAREALPSLEYIPVGAKIGVALAARLSEARVKPAVFRLPFGEIFVGGGTTVDGAPIASAEWLPSSVAALQATGPVGKVSLCNHRPGVFAPLEGGATLAVFAGKPPKGCSNVLVLRHGDAPNEFKVDIASPLFPEPTAPMFLLGGAQSSPVLVTADGLVRQWQPWDSEGEFEIMPGAGPVASLPSAALSADPGLALWAADDARIHALRFDTRNTYSDAASSAPLLETDPSEFAPDRLAGSDVAWTTGMPTGLLLRGGSSAYLTDATFADFAVDFTYFNTGNTLLQVVLRDDAAGASFFVPSSCLPLPLHGAPVQVHLERQGAIVSVSDGGSPSPCPVGPLEASERLAFGFQSVAQATHPTGEAIVSTVTVTRLGSPD